MSRVITHRFAATLLAAGLLLSACGQSDASGRIRNSSLGEGCFATQAAKESEVSEKNFYIRRALKAEEGIPKLESELQELTKQLRDSFDDANVNSESAVREQIVNLERILSADKALAAEFKQRSENLALIEAKPVCESSVNNNTEETPDVIPVPESPENSTPDSSASSVSSETCKEALQIPSGSTRTISVGESIELEFLMCSNTASLNVFADRLNPTNNSGTTIYLNMVEDDQSRKMIVRFTGTIAGTEKFYFQHVEPDSSVGYPPSWLDLTVVDPIITLPCAGLTPNIIFRPEGFTFSSNCDKAESISLTMYRSDDGSFVLDIKVDPTLLRAGKGYTSKSFFYLLGTDKYDVVGQYIDIDGNPIGQQLTGNVQFKESKGSQEEPSQPSGIVELPPVLFVDNNAIKDNKDDNHETGQVSPTKAVLPVDTRALSCADACRENVVKQSGIALNNVETIEVSINGSEWVTFSTETIVPLIASTSNVVVRVTPKDGSKPVALTSTLYRDAAAVNTPVNPEIIAIGMSGEQTITVEPASSNSSPSTTFIVLIIALLAGLLIVVIRVLPRIKRKSEIS